MSAGVAFEMRRCKGCGAKIFWLSDARGTKHCLDPSAPVYRVTTDLTGERVVERTDAFITHFKTCPKVNDFSGSSRAGGAR